jgi:glycosyltransferase involved in cell wall biosynthesis
MQNDLVTVSVHMITYNHAPFIAQALDSILKQDTDFLYDIVIGEDASDDTTREILLAYKKKFPDKIKLILHKENVGIRENYRMTLAACRGKYIALCEGDDYWGDPLKLQKQVDFLETNEDYSICYHNSFIVDNENRMLQENFSDTIRDYSCDEMLVADAVILTNTAMFRNFGERLSPPLFHDIINGDMAVWHILGKYGKGKFLENVGNSYYRLHSGGVWSSIGHIRRVENTIKTLQRLQQNLPEEKEYLKAKITDKIAKYDADILTVLLKKVNLTAYMKQFFKICLSVDRFCMKSIGLHIKQIYHAVAKKLFY